MGVRVLQRPAPHVDKNLGHGDREIHKKGERPDHCAGRGKDCRKTQNDKEVEVLHSKPPGVPVETRWCTGAVH